VGAHRILAARESRSCAAMSERGDEEDKTATHLHEQSHRPTKRKKADASPPPPVC
jgi:hypothetical protein